MLEEGIEILLTKDSGVSALLGTNRGDGTNGLFANISVKQPTYPYIVYEKLSAESNETLEGLNKFQIARFRFKCYAADYPTAVKLAHKVRLALGGFAGTLQDSDATPLGNANPIFEADLPPEAALRATTWGRVIDFEFCFADTAA
jgi:hypothetical protein